ncbi:beta-xylosidase [Acidobacteria bacterium AB60]|nr:beta-xylosidase [Acidobacteria bacterium AB60]
MKQILQGMLLGAAVTIFPAHAASNGQAQATVAAPAAETNAQPVSITVELDQKVGAYVPIYRWFGYDEANYTTMRHGRELLRELHDLSPAPVYIRVHHLLTSGDGMPELKFSSTSIYSEDSSGKPVYDFKIIDGIFDAYREAGVRPLVELGFMPKDLAADLRDRHEPYQVHFPQSTVSGKSNNPPKDYGKWEELVRVLTAHLVERYGREAVLTWYFEVWNEPDIDYWHTTPEEYWKLYDYAVAGVRAALPEAKVGGPASTSPGREKAYTFLKNFLEHVNSGRSAAGGGEVPLDFISFHAKGSPKIAEGVVTMGLNRELIDVDKGFELVASFPKFRNLPIILSEADPEGCAACSSKMNPANNYRNGTLYPAYTAAAYKSIFELADRHGVNLISMLSWSFEFEGKDYFEGFRSLATNGIDKPILNLFRMLGMLSGDRVRTSSSGAVPLETLLQTGVREAPAIDAFATRSSQQAGILLWNYHDVNRPAPSAPVTVTVQGIPAGVSRVLLQHYRIDDTHSNAYTVWRKMGSPQNPSADQYAELKAAGQIQLGTSPVWLEVKNGELRITTDLPREGVSFLHLEW